jgi:hypothetical protein
MTTATLAPPASDPSVSPGGLAARQVRYFKAQVEDWYDECRHLADWEDQNLLDNPAPEQLAEHARLLDELERVGHWLSRTVQSPDFPDPATAQLVAMTLQDLKDCRALWHRPKMSEARRAEILKACFHES